MIKRKLRRLFKREKKTSAATAKERLQIIISHERMNEDAGAGNFLERLQKDLLEVIARNFKVDPQQIREMVKVDVGRQGGNSVIELNITLPENDLITAG